MELILGKWIGKWIVIDFIYDNEIVETLFLCIFQINYNWLGGWTMAIDCNKACQRDDLGIRFCDSDKWIIMGYSDVSFQMFKFLKFTVTGFIFNIAMIIIFFPRWCSILQLS